MIEQESTKQKIFCPQCKKHVRKTERNGVTAWVLRLSSCSCIDTAYSSQSLQESCSSSEGNLSSDTSMVEASIPDCIAGRYEVLELLGKGGMGTVYKVKDKAIDRILSLKLLEQSLTSDNTALKRFVQEAEAAAKLNHPNLVPVYGNGITEDGEAYLLMEYVQGESLAQTIEREGALEENRAIAIFSQLSEALSHAHDKNILHRDIKPANVILSKSENGDEIARLVDFGIAKTLPASDRETRDLTQTGEVFGSPHYMSPEQCLGFMLDQRSDIYSFGCLIYEALAGKPPFSGSNPIQLVVSHINDAVNPFLSKYGSSSKLRSLQSIALRCLEKQQIDRFQDFDEITELLASVSQGKRVTESIVKNSTFSKQITPLAFILPIIILITSLIMLSIPKQSDSTFPSNFAVLVTLIPFYCLIHLFVQSYFMCKKIVRNDLASKKHWWMTLSLLFSALILGGIFPSFVMYMIYSNSLINTAYLPDFFQYWDVFTSFCIALSVVSAVAAVVCSFGYLLDRGARNVKIASIQKKAAIFTTIAIMFLGILLPGKCIDLAANISASMSEGPKELSSGVGLRSLEFLLKLSPDNNSIIKKCARASNKERKLDKAIGFYTSLIERTPQKEKETLANNYSNRAYAYFKSKNFPKAIADYTQEIKLNPDTGFGYLGRARVYLKMSKLEEALADYDKETELRPWHSTPYYMRAKVYLENQEFKRAIAEYTKRIKLETGGTTAVHVCLAYVYEMENKSIVAQKKYKAALNLENSGKEKECYPYLCRTIAYLKLGQSEKAAQEYAIAKTKENFNRNTLEDDFEILPDNLAQVLRKFAPEIKEDMI